MSILKIMLFCCSITCYIIALNEDLNRLIRINQKIMEKETTLISVIDPELYEFCQKIRKRMGIKEEVVFKFFDDNEINTKKNILGYYHPNYKTVHINQQDYHFALESADYCELLYTIVHELEHYRQNNKYSGSYHGNDYRLKETGADAAAAGFFDCYVCLLCIARNKKFNTTSTTQSQGYFVASDYDCYISLLLKNNKICDSCYKRFRKKSLN